MAGRVSLQELNEVDQDTFVGAIGAVFEGSPWIAAQAISLASRVYSDHIRYNISGGLSRPDSIC